MQLSPGDQVVWDGGAATGVVRARLGGEPSDPLLAVTREDGREVLRFAHELQRPVVKAA